MVMHDDRPPISNAPTAHPFPDRLNPLDTYKRWHCSHQTIFCRSHVLTLQSGSHLESLIHLRLQRMISMSIRAQASCHPSHHFLVYLLTGNRGRQHSTRHCSEGYSSVIELGFLPPTLCRL